MPGAAAVHRLHREECKRTKHDSAFSEWKILVGPSDWQDYVLGVEGAERYRTQNLPNSASCPGIYELGIISVPKAQSRLETNKNNFDTANVVPVYVGQADNVRTRLQQYGRDGSHLENGCAKADLSSDKDAVCLKGPSFFTSSFSRGFTIAYRWAPMKSKKDAERAETQLLDTFDYAWNSDSNGARRDKDVFSKFEFISSRASSLPLIIPSIITRLKSSFQKPKGIKIEACEPLPLQNGSQFYNDAKSSHFLPQIFKFGRSRPTIVSVNSGVNENHVSSICGVALGHGSVCIRSPASKGSKRCFEHRGMKINGLLTPKLIADDEKNSEETRICGFLLENGSACVSKPFGKNKRCIEHKGRRIPGKGKEMKVQSEMQKSYDDSQDECLRNKEDITQCLIISPFKTTASEDERSNSVRTCGATLKNGSSCRRKLAEGNNKRCWQHS
ncbi:unnamed protein product [Cuscuta epithymum]|uniref:GIY-YIG homing endonuclease n=1 Tax=Cuscuta epithymum TaxID=186058 RepID=A0AAV0G7C9_9ASTE|nr:unnamed protein product [Cuscuta epithymum]